MGARRILAPLAALVAAGACTVPELDLEGRPCPCADGYTCDEATDTCVRGDASGTTSTTATSGGSTASTSVSSGPGAGGGGDGGGATSASSASSTSSGGGSGGATSGSGGAGGAGGAGGGGECPAPLVPADIPCGGITDAFTDPDAFAASWSLTGSAALFTVDGQLTIEMPAGGPVFASTNQTYDLDGCSIWVRIVAPSEDPGVMTRLSYAIPGEGSRHNIGIEDGEIQARLDETILASRPYDPEEMRFVRMRGDGPLVHFGTSADGICWSEFHLVQDDAKTGVNARLVLIRHSGPTGPNQAIFDDFGLTP